LDLSGKSYHWPAMSDVTQILRAIEEGKGTAATDLLPLVYDELRKLAASKMAQEAPGHTLQPTALVHEAWMRLVKGEAQAQFANRAHFFAAAAEAMRRILIESARRKSRLKHGGQWERVEFEAVEISLPMPPDELLALDEALDGLAALDSQAAEIVKLCFFAGFTQEQAARELGVSLATVERRWAFARAWLFKQIQKEAQA
jgi:RNA polymerase sigma factor (TIGR02999 family)